MVTLWVVEHFDVLEHAARAWAFGSSEVDQAEAETTLMTAARGCGLPDGQARRTIASRINSEIEHPRQRLASGAAATRREHGAEGERSAR